MTAEVAILNEHGVALAADRRVTISGGGATSTFDEADKIYRLSDRHPVGLMVYNYPSFMAHRSAL